MLQPEMTAWSVLPYKNASEGELPQEYRMKSQEPAFWNSQELYTEVLTHEQARTSLLPEWTKEKIEASVWTAELCGGRDGDKMIYPVDAGRAVILLPPFCAAVFLACEVK